MDRSDHHVDCAFGAQTQRAGSAPDGHLTPAAPFIGALPALSSTSLRVVDAD
jgi:hypothetical protein